MTTKSLTLSANVSGFLSNITSDPLIGTGDPLTDVHPEPGWALLVLLVIPVMAVVVNCLVCAAVRKHLPLQTSSFYILASLAVVDILRAILVGGPLLTRTVTGNNNYMVKHTNIFPVVIMEISWKSTGEGGPGDQDPLWPAKSLLGYSNLNFWPSGSPSFESQHLLSVNF